MDFRTAADMASSGYSITRSAWGDDDLFLDQGEDDLIVVRSKADPSIEQSPSEEDMAARDWEIRRAH